MKHYRWLAIAIAAFSLALLLATASPLAAQGNSAPTPTPTPFTFSPGKGIYIVQRGDTLSSIAWRFRTTVAILARVNYVYNSNYIWVGMRLIIPVAYPPNATPTPAPPGSYQTYIVQRGDTLYRIAVRFGTSVYALIVANNIPNANLIYAGMALVIPTLSRPPTPVPTVPPPATPPSIPYPVVLRNLQFAPNPMTIRQGSTVTWLNIDTVQHTVTSGTPGVPSGLFDSGTLNQSQWFSYTFTSTGTFPYYCRNHSAMTGTITVIP
ncbi:MAG: LysM peptidoglycan-binding domain-containing protein [Chloroflexi bacterium]|nr:LysM peptidoglycan-binding domain-containing protein [Chloroflexota bacterium]